MPILKLSFNQFSLIPITHLTSYLSCAYQYNVLEREKAEVTILIGCFPHYTYFFVHLDVVIIISF